MSYLKNILFCEGKCGRVPVSAMFVRNVLIGGEKPKWLYILFLLRTHKHLLRFNQPVQDTGTLLVLLYSLPTRVHVHRNSIPLKLV